MEAIYRIGVMQGRLFPPEGDDFRRSLVAPGAMSLKESGPPAFPISSGFTMTMGEMPIQYSRSLVLLNWMP